MSEQKKFQNQDFKFYSAQSLWFAFVALRGTDARAKPVELQENMKIIYKDILAILNSLYRSRRLLIDHLRVLNFYGRKGRAPRAWVKKEMRAHTLWKEALDILASPMIGRGYLVSETAQKWQQALDEVNIDIDAGQNWKADMPDYAAIQSKTPHDDYKGQ
jgi:hypothetical protein